MLSKSHANFAEETAAPEEGKSQFYKFTTETSKKLRDFDLSAAEWKIWAYLATLDPFGDKYVRLPDMHTVMAECGTSKATVYRAMSKFQELELFDFQAEIAFRNLEAKSTSSKNGKAVPKIEKQSEKVVEFSTSLTGETGVSPVRLDSHPCDWNLTHETGISPMRKSSFETTTGQDSQNPSDSSDSKSFKTTDNSVVAGQKKAAEEEDEEGDSEPKVSREELDAAMTQLRAIGVKLNQTVRSTVQQNYANVDAAIAHIKERLAAGEQFRCLEAAFVKACKVGAKPEGALRPGLPVENNPPSNDQIEQLEKAKASGTIRDYYLSSDGTTKVVMPNLRDQQPWWIFLGIEASSTGDNKIAVRHNIVT